MSLTDSDYAFKLNVRDLPRFNDLLGYGRSIIDRGSHNGSHGRAFNNIPWMRPTACYPNGRLVCVVNRIGKGFGRLAGFGHGNF